MSWCSCETAAAAAAAVGERARGTAGEMVSQGVIVPVVSGRTGTMCGEGRGGSFGTIPTALVREADGDAEDGRKRGRPVLSPLSPSRSFSSPTLWVSPYVLVVVVDMTNEADGGLLSATVLWRRRLLSVVPRLLPSIDVPAILVPLSCRDFSLWWWSSRVVSFFSPCVTVEIECRGEEVDGTLDRCSSSDSNMDGGRPNEACRSFSCILRLSPGSMPTHDGR